ncbi:conserved domain protein [Actinomyces sp. oral taxon 170 str. F0386]|nr:conserved domain protein [Actinomyces sp. oral taxon 170 str. F0386]
MFAVTISAPVVDCLSSLSTVWCDSSMRLRPRLGVEVDGVPGFHTANYGEILRTH